MGIIKLKEVQILIICLILTCSCKISFAQGGWNIKYIPIEHINTLLIGKEVRFDFKESNQDTLNDLIISKLDTRHLLNIQDTVEITVKNEKIFFIERWKLYDDQVFLEDQYIESVNPLGIIIKKMTLKKRSNFAIYVDAELVRNGHLQIIEITFDKAIIKGVLIKE